MRGDSTAVLSMAETELIPIPEATKSPTKTTTTSLTTSCLLKCNSFSLETNFPLLVYKGLCLRLDKGKHSNTCILEKLHIVISSRDTFIKNALRTHLVGYGK